MEILGERLVWSMSDSEQLSTLDAVHADWLAAQMGRIHSLDWHGSAHEATDVVPFYHRVDVGWPALVDVAERGEVSWASTLRG
ncbi:hypothetical protein [Kribbella sp. VKM Ac-2568]|uniref:hypothetical protein n=1 Tax=Kribbella sp. VKM Ac-2568 TaxID=2512219 RepID=UPI00104C5F3B|nr:hypothetical protein [Kribbella sp. VKM Ac-2568]TCM44517.1 hypothetical protein EV648_108389 [Kribbella sp. VKM Ac-2568]